MRETESSSVLHSSTSQTASATPWEFYLGNFSYSRTSQSGLTSLSSEIRACGDWLSPTKEEHERRQLFVECLRRKLNHVYPWSELVTFGSLLTKLYLPDGEIDVAVVWFHGKPAQGHEHPFDPRSRLLSDIWPIFKWHYFSGDVGQLPEATSRPRAKMARTQSAFERQIRLSNQDGSKVVAWINDQLSIKPSLRPFIMVLKAWVARNGLNEWWSGGINCYCLIVMIVSFFQLHYSVPDTDDQIEHEAGELLVNFFGYYGGVSTPDPPFSYDKAISVLGRGCVFDPRDRGWVTGEASQLFAEDPCDIHNNLGAAVFDVEKMRQAFRETREMLIKAVRDKETGDFSGSVLNAILGYDEEYVARRDALSTEYPLAQLRGILGTAS